MKYQHPPLFTQLEVMPHRLSSLCERLIANQNQFSGKFFRLAAYLLLSRADKGGYKYTSISGSVKPLFAVIGARALIIAPVHNHRQLERIIEKKQISVDLILPPGYGKTLHAGEALRKLAPYQ